MWETSYWSHTLVAALSRNFPSDFYSLFVLILLKDVDFLVQSLASAPVRVVASSILVLHADVLLDIENQ